MFKYKFQLLIVSMVLSIVSIFITGCNKQKETTGTLKIVFNQKVKGQDFEFGKFTYQAKAGYPYMITTLRYFTSMFNLHKKDGTSFEIDTFHYREADLNHEYTRVLIINDIPSATYNGISFLHGLGDRYNKPIGGTEAHSLPNGVDEYLDMYWPWQEDGQYHYMKYEGAYIKDNDTLSFKLHTGPTDGNKNYINIGKLTFDDKEVSEGDTLVLTLEMDMNEWLENPKDYDFNEFGKGIMKNQDAQTILKANGESVYKLSKVELK